MRPPPAWFRWLLAVLPSSFRAEHGEEICELASRYARDRSLVGRTLVWMRASVDLLGVAIRSRVADRSGGPAGGSGLSRLVGELMRDVRHSGRSLRNDPGFSVFAILIVGVGIGASVTVFSVVQALLLRPLPFAEPERLVWISNGEFGRGQRLSSISVQVGRVVEMRTGASQLEDVAGYHLFDRDGDHTLATGNGRVRATRLRVTENFLSVLGVEPAYGRFFTPEEAMDGGPRAIVLSHGSWLRHFGGDPAVVGSNVVLDGSAATVVGVLPSSFDFTTIFSPGQPVDYLSPYPLSERSDRSGNTLGLIGRLAGGASLASARAELAVFAVPDEEAGAGVNSFHPVIRPLRDHLSGSFRPAMALLAGAVTLVMVIVCANLSNLLLARGAAREREVAIRAAIGAHRARLVRQLLTESLVISVAGTVLGVALAVNGTRLLASLDLRIPMLAGVTVDATALALAVSAALAVGLLFGVLPALRGSRVHLNESLEDGARSVTSGRGHATLRRSLVVGQVAVASLLLVASTLTARSLLNLLDTDLGYETEGAVAIRIDPSERFASNEDRLRHYGEVLDRIRSAPGVTAAGVSDILPMAFNRRWDARAMQLDPEHRVFPYVRVVSGGYLDAMGLTLVAGRDFRADDGPDAPRVALINDVLGEQLFGDRDPLGYQVRSSGREYEVVGVVRATRQLSVDQEPGPEMFFTMRQVPDQAAVHLIVRGAQPAGDLTRIARAELIAIDARIPLDRVVPIRDVVDASLAPRRFVTTLLTLFAGFAVTLAALGVYAVISYSVAHRRSEIGIHLALGATSGDVQRRLSRETVSLTALGIGLGLTVAVLASRVLDGFLFGIASSDPVTYLGAALGLGAVALASGWLPVRRASRRNPLESLGGNAAPS